MIEILLRLNRRYATRQFLRAFRALKRAAKFTPSLRDEKMSFLCKDRIMTKTEDQAPGYICPDHDLSMTSR